MADKFDPLTLELRGKVILLRSTLEDLRDALLNAPQLLDVIDSVLHETEEVPAQERLGQ